MTASLLEEWFPNLAAAGYAVTSPSTLMYNCFAWAAGDNEHSWEPDRVMSNVYWPTGVERKYTLSNYMQVFATLGYVACEDSKLEDGIEKVALFTDEDGSPSHAARQLISGVWTSKLGDAEDIEHNTLEALEGDVYGTVAQILRRPRSDLYANTEIRPLILPM